MSGAAAVVVRPGPKYTGLHRPMGYRAHFPDGCDARFY